LFSASKKRRRNSIIIQSKDTGQVRAEQKKNRIILYTLVSDNVSGLCAFVRRVWTFLLSAHNREALSCAGNEKCCWSNECTHGFSFQSDTHGPNTAAAFLISAIMQHFLYTIKPAGTHTQNTTVLRCDARGAIIN
jgi:hypothetical protein